MKHLWKAGIVPACVATIMGLMSCGHSDDIPSRRRTVEKEGEPADITISFTTPGLAMTRATDELAATENESKVNTVDVYIYLHTGPLQKHERLTYNSENFEFDRDTNTHTSKTGKLKTTTGNRYVLVGINLPDALAEKLEKVEPTQYSSVAQTLSYNQMVGESANSFVMFSDFRSTTNRTGAPEISEINSGNNKVSVKVARLVSKVTVQIADDMEEAGYEGAIDKDNMKFIVDNFNIKTYMMQRVASKGGGNYTIMDPNESYVPADFANAYTDLGNFTYSFNVGNPTGGYAAVTTTGTQAEARYVSENVAKDGLKNELTRVIVQTTFIPKHVYSKTATWAEGADNKGKYEKTTSVALGKTDPETFYRVMTDGSYDGEASIYTFDLEVARQYSADHGGSEGKAGIWKYEDGYCYYDLFLNNNPKPEAIAAGQQKFGVYRNNYYKCVIKKIVAPGYCSPILENPTKKPSESIGIEAEITISDWSELVEEEFEIER